MCERKKGLSQKKGTPWHFVGGTNLTIPPSQRHGARSGQTCPRCRFPYARGKPRRRLFFGSDGGRGRFLAFFLRRRLGTAHDRADAESNQATRQQDSSQHGIPLSRTTEFTETLILGLGGRTGKGRVPARQDARRRRDAKGKSRSRVPRSRELRREVMSLT